MLELGGRAVTAGPEGAEGAEGAYQRLIVVYRVAEKQASDPLF